MRILIWATTFGADLYSLTRYLDDCEDVDVRVVMADPKRFAKEGVATLFPLKAPIHPRRWYSHVAGIPGFRPDVTIMDNRVPMRATSPNGFVLWHGFGWKGPNDRAEFRVLHAQLRKAWGDPLAPNPNFRWQTFGPFDFEHRTQVSGFHPENCRQLGAASHDDLRVPFDRERARAYYPFDIVGRPTVLLAPTWHYGEVFAHWGRDADLFDRLLTRIGERGANVILRLHDSFRFTGAYRAYLDGLGRRFDHVMVKYKDQSPDNFLDIQVSDVLITNYSSIANLFYATGRPTIHVYPVKDADETFMWRTYSVLGVREKEVENARFVWKLPPEEHGGLLSRSFDDLLAQVEQALDDPTCCAAATAAFLDKHMLGADGNNRQRILGALEELVAAR